jgi:hypothetical protein
VPDRKETRVTQRIEQIYNRAIAEEKLKSGTK